jgi:hypothetical protein
MFKKKTKKGSRCLVLALFLVAVMACSAFALYDAPNKELQTYICTNTSGTAYGKTAISTSTITVANHRVIGYAILPYDTTKGSELVASFYDDTTANTASYVFDEVELGATNDRLPRILPYPKRLTRGLTVWQGPNTVVVVYYEDVRKF